MARAKGQETTKGGDGEEDQPYVGLPKHPAFLPSCLYCGHKIHRLLHSGLVSRLPGRSMAPSSRQSWLCRLRAQPGVSPSFARSARVRTVTRELKGNRAVSILWILNYGHANQRSKAFIRTKRQNCLSPVALGRWGLQSDTPKSEVLAALAWPVQRGSGGSFILHPTLKLLCYDLLSLP